MSSGLDVIYLPVGGGLPLANKREFETQRRIVGRDASTAFPAARCGNRLCFLQPARAAASSGRSLDLGAVVYKRLAGVGPARDDVDPTSAPLTRPTRYAPAAYARGCSNGCSWVVGFRLWGREFIAFGLGGVNHPQGYND
jgi:hypothetical protein